MNLNLTDQGHADDIRPEDMAAIFSSINAWILKIDQAGSILYTNKMSGEIPEQNLIGSSILNLVDGENRTVLLETIEKVFKNQKSESFATTFSEGQGNKKYYNTTLIPGRLQGDFPSAFIVFHDVTAYKQIEIALLQSEERYKQLSNLTFEGIIIDDDGVIVDCNDTFLNMSGYGREQITGMPLKKLLSNDQSIEEVLNRLNSDNKAPWEATGRRKDGKEAPVEIQFRYVNYKGRNLRAIAFRDISERKKAEQELRKLYTAIEQSSSNIVITDKSGMIEYVNPAFTATTGYTIEEAIGQNPSILKTDLHDSKYYGKLWRTILAGKVWNGEFLNRKKNGETYWEKAIISPVFNERKKITHFLAIKENITEHKQAEAALLQSEERHRIISELISDFVYRFELDGTHDFELNWTSGAFKRITGYSIEEINVLGNKWLSIIHPEDKERVTENFFQYLDDDNAIRSEYRIITKEGKTKWLSDYIKPIYNEESGEIMAVLGAVQDITAKKTAEEALKASEANKNLLLEVIPDLIFVFNRQGIFLNVFTEENSKLFMPQKNFIGKPFSKVFPKELSDEFYENLERAFETGYVQTFEYSSVLERVTSYYEARLIVFGHDELIAVIRDITDKKRADSSLIHAMEAAEKASRSKSAFLANMSHEIRTPINAVLGFADLLYAQIEEPAHKNYLQSIISSGNALLTLLNDILDLSKIEAGKMDISPARVDVVALFEEVQHIFSLKASAKGLDYIIDVEGMLRFRVELDELRLRQILLNLIDNAIKFTDKGVVRVSCKSRVISKIDDQTYISLEIAVADSGIGIPVEDHEKIFQAFVQKDEQDKRKYGGTGLGLAITKRLANLMGGDVVLQSKASKGSVFTVRFDRLRAYQIPVVILPSPSGSEPAKIKSRNKTILIADDERSNRRQFKSAFEGEKLHFMEYEDVIFLESGKLPTKPDLMIISFEKSHEELANIVQKIRNVRLLSDVPLVVVNSGKFLGITSICSNDTNCVSFQRPVKLSDFIGRVGPLLSSTGLEQESQEIAKQKEQRRVTENNHALIQVLEEYIMPKWESTAYTASFTEIELFAEEIGDIADRYDSDQLRVFSKQLMMHTHHFDIDNMHALLGSFPKLLENLKKAGHA